MPTTPQVLGVVQFVHPYFTDKKLTTFEVIPTADTQSVLNINQLGFAQRENQLIIYSKAAASSSPAEGLKLDFLFKSLDPLFLNYTDLPIEGGQPGVFIFQTEANSLVLRAEDSEPEADHQSETPPEAQHPTFSPLALLKLHLAEASDTPPTYTLNFSARATIWRYYFMSQTDELPEDLTIEQRGLATDFIDGGTTSILGQENVRVFHSDTAHPMPLRDHYNDVAISLLSGETKLISALPTPSAQSLNIDPTTGYYYSDMYVYL